MVSLRRPRSMANSLFALASSAFSFATSRLDSTNRLPSRATVPANSLLVKAIGLDRCAFRTVCQSATKLQPGNMLDRRAFDDRNDSMIKLRLPLSNIAPSGSPLGKCSITTLLIVIAKAYASGPPSSKRGK